MNKILIALCILCGTSVFSNGLVADSSSQITVVDDSAWVRATPPGAKTTAIYLNLMNHGSANVKLIAASSEISNQIELHTHKHEDGVMKMLQVEFIDVPSGEHAVLAPHDDHIMVFNPKHDLQTGDVVALTLSFDDGSEMIIEVPVLKEGPDSNGDHMQHAETDHGKKAKHGDKHKNH